MNARPGWRELHPPLAVHLGLLLLTILLLGAMPAIEAAGGGTEHAVVTGIMAGDAADDGALDAALGLGSLLAARVTYALRERTAPAAGRQASVHRAGAFRGRT